VKWRDSLVQAAPPLAITALVFLYRWYLLAGIGGYRDAGSGASFFYKLSPIRTTKGLLARSAAVTIFPMNWSAVDEWWLIAALLIGVAVMAAVAIWEPLRGRIARTELWFGMGFFLIAALPVHLFLLIDADLEKSRVLYLPIVGAALMVGVLLDALKPAWAIGLAGALLVFQTAALEHNLTIWRSVAELVENTCSNAAATLENDVLAAPGPVRMTGIPNVVDGVYFLHTGFRRCVEQAAGRESLPQLRTDTDLLTAPEGPEAVPGESVRSYRWNGKLRRLVAE
jgi:hypothetical protein